MIVEVRERIVAPTWRACRFAGGKDSGREIVEFVGGSASDWTVDLEGVERIRVNDQGGTMLVGDWVVETDAEAMTYEVVPAALWEDLYEAVGRPPAFEPEAEPLATSIPWPDDRQVATIGRVGPIFSDPDD